MQFTYLADYVGNRVKFLADNSQGKGIEASAVRKELQPWPRSIAN